MTLNKIDKKMIDESFVQDVENVKNKTTDLTAQLAEKASKEEVNQAIGQIAEGTPLFAEGVAGMADVSRLYVNTADGLIYRHNGTEFTSTGVQYQSTGIADGAITEEKTTMKTGFSEIRDATEYLTGKQYINSFFTQSDLTVPRGFYTITNGSLYQTTDTEKQFSHVLFPDDVIEFEYKLKMPSNYIIIGQANDIIHMIYLTGSSPGKVYPVSANGTALGSLITTIPIIPAGTDDIIKIERKSDRIVFTRNGLFWFEITDANYPSLLKNRFGMLSSGTTFVDRLIATDVKKLKRKITDVSGIEKIETFYSSPHDPDAYFSTVKWGTVGDSITRNDGGATGTNYRHYVVELLGIQENDNIAVSGSKIARKIDGYQDAHAMVTKYINLSNDCDIITVFGGTNDYQGGGKDGIPIGEKGSSDPYEFYGALKILIEGLHTKIPTAKIAFITPLQRGSQDVPNLQGHVLKDYVNAIIDICSDYSVPVLNLYDAGGLNILNFETFTTDRLHPNAVFNEMLGRKIAKFIDDL